MPFFFSQVKNKMFLMSQVLCDLLSNNIFGDAAFGTFESEIRKEYIGWGFGFVCFIFSLNL